MTKRVITKGSMKTKSHVEEEPKPYWTIAHIRPRFDIALLRPPSLPRGQRFETAADARALSRRHERALRRASKLLVVDADDDAISRLKKMSSPDHGRNGVVAEELVDPVDQLSYLQKFGTFHRPGKQTSKRRPRAYPLPPGPLLELLRWMSKYRFDDFRFLFGARRRGTRIRREKHRPT